MNIPQIPRFCESLAPSVLSDFPVHSGACLPASHGILRLRNGLENAHLWSGGDWKLEGRYWLILQYELNTFFWAFMVPPPLWLFHSSQLLADLSYKML